MFTEVEEVAFSRIILRRINDEVAPVSPWVTRAQANTLPAGPRYGDSALYESPDQPISRRLQRRARHVDGLAAWVTRNPDECTQDFDGFCRCNFR